MGLQLAIALAVDVRLVPGLLLVWAWFGLMSKEFFARGWLRAHPIAYIASHMAIVPLIDWYVTRSTGSSPACRRRTRWAGSSR